MSLPPIDWNSVWQEIQPKEKAPMRDTAFWDRRAPEFTRHTTASDYIGRFLEIMKPESHWSVLDIGCAAGTLAVPLSSSEHSMFPSCLKQTAAICAFILFAILAVEYAEGREIVDMAGRTVTVPDHITKVYGASPPATYLLYAVNPNLLAGLNFPFNPAERQYLNSSVESLPVLGGWFGQGRTPNQEAILKVKPDVMVVWMWQQMATNEKIEQTAIQLMLPMVYVRLDRLGDYPETFRFMGKLLGREDRAHALSEYAVQALGAVEPAAKTIPEDGKVSVYYAEGRDGLSTECDQSLHTELINLAGGKNIYRCSPRDWYGMERISMEAVVAADPEVILAQEKEFVDGVYSDPRWQSIRAVKNKKVHLIPRSPFNWFDRPPSFMRLLGIRWLANILYPDRFPFDPARETREFYNLFLGVQLNDHALQAVLQR